VKQRLVRSRQWQSMVDGVGNTPLIRLDRISKSAPSVEIYLKLEFCNPGGSVKDRPGLRMVQQAVASGQLSAGKTLIDATSGNTGVAYSWLGAALGVKIALVMPANVSKARKDITKAFGTELIFSSAMEGSDGAIRKVRELVEQNPDKYFYSDQYSNPNNPLAHYHGTGVEILDALGDRITHFVTSLGTSGTAMGTTRRRTRRSVARPRRPQAHGVEHRAENFRSDRARRDHAGPDGGRLGHGRALGTRRRPACWAFDGSQRLGGAPHRGRAASHSGRRLRRHHRLRP
jgi:S-sulfo-L-cysteine synthase (O-acetyl-L-serine-dependent)